MENTVEQEISEEGEYKMMPLSFLRRNPANPRGSVSVADCEELIASVKRHGILQPLVVKPDGQIIAGERRYVAAMAAGLSVVAVVVRETESCKEDGELSLVENIQRENLTPIAEAKAYEEMLKSGLSVKQVAEHVGVRVARIHSYLKLLGLPDFVQDAVEEQRLSVSGSLSLLMIDDNETLKETAFKAIEENWGEREIKDSIQVKKDRRVKPKAESYSVIINRALDKIEAGRVILEKLPEYEEPHADLVEIKSQLKGISKRLIDVETRIVDVMIASQKKADRE